VSGAARLEGLGRLSTLDRICESLDVPMGGGIRAARVAGNDAMIGTAKRNGMDPEAYLRYRLERIVKCPINRVVELRLWAVAKVLMLRSPLAASFVYEPAASRLVIQLTDNVDSPEPTRVIELINIQQLEIHWTDRDDNRIEGLLGAGHTAVSAGCSQREQAAIWLGQRSTALSSLQWMQEISMKRFARDRVVQSRD
jgi:hypothetical protein